MTSTVTPSIRSAASALLVAAIACAAAPAAASPLYLTFEAFADLTASSITYDKLPSRQYVFKVDMDRPGSYVDAGGTLATLPMGGTYHFFHAELVVGNYLKAELPDAGYRNIGSWLADGVTRQNVWGTGPTYGTFDYLTTFNVTALGDNDVVQIAGFWPQLLEIDSIEKLTSPGAMWHIYDNGRAADGHDYWGNYRAKLSAISAVDPTDRPLPAPGTIWLTAAAFAALAAALRSGHRSAGPVPQAI